jgi:peptidoglycan/xylan/chitin deacetylase (PgdA/CDA1 family)
MYHSISDDPEPGVHPYYRVCTSPARFREHMKFLHDNGYQVIPLSAAVDLLSRPGPSVPSSSPRDELATRNPEPAMGSFPSPSSSVLSPEPAPSRPDGRLVVLTFDDGYRDFYTQAAPVVQSYGFPTTAYLSTGFVTDTGTEFKGKPFLTWSEVKALEGSGVQFGSHTVTHPKLGGMQWDGIEWEIRESKKVLEEQIGNSVGSFSYPYAFPEEDLPFTTRLKGILELSGYSSCVTTIIGLAQPGDDRFCLKRIPVNSEDDPSLFRAKLEGGYDWAHGIQYVFKTVSKMLHITRESRVGN